MLACHPPWNKRTGPCEVLRNIDLFPRLPVAVRLHHAGQDMWVRATVQPMSVDPVPKPDCARFPPL
eukprot:5349113-Pyramimonas_sp.AAC.1